VVREVDVPCVFELGLVVTRRENSRSPGIVKRMRSLHDAVMLEVVSVNVSIPQVLAKRDGRPVYSAISKRPVPFGTALWLSTVNLAGDAQADLSVHGGADKAVYAFATEHLSSWSADLGETLQPGAFGENLSTHGATERDVYIGDVWRWNDAVLQVSQPRWPCFKLALYRNSPHVQHLMRTTGRTGWYLRVLARSRCRRSDRDHSAR
jgi:MOSC domain-containing protein YiiM